MSDFRKRDRDMTAGHEQRPINRAQQGGNDPSAILAPPPPPQPKSNYDSCAPATDGERYQYATDNTSDAATPSLKQADNVTLCEVPVHRGTAPKNWPTEARRLHEATVVSRLLVMLDLILALAPVTFLVFGALAAHLEGQATKDNTLGYHIEQALQVGPTLFPIVFAGIVGRTMKIFATYAAQKGAKLGLLELLVASQSTWGTISSQLLLQRSSVLGILLVALWVLSPIGGQSFLRVLLKDTAFMSSMASIRYMDTGPATLLVGVDALGQADSARDWNAMNSVFTASLLQSNEQMTAAQDIFGNVRIPRMSSLRMQEVDRDGWTPVGSNLTAPEDYVSLTGLPVVGLGDGHADFSVEASYLDVQCPALVTTPISSDVFKAWKVGLSSIYLNSTARTLYSPLQPGLFGIPSFQTGWFVDTSTALSNANRLAAAQGQALNATSSGDPTLLLQRYFAFGSRWAKDASSDPQMLLANCTLKNVHVEVSVHCQSPQTCSATRMRVSRQNTIPEQFSILDDLVTATYFVRNFLTSTGNTLTHQSASSGQSSPVEYFLADSSVSPYSKGRAAQAASQLVNFDGVSADALGRRLGLLVNTYYYLSISPLAPAGNLPTNLSLYGPVGVNPVSETATPEQQSAFVNAPLLARAATAGVQQPYEVYLYDRGWLAVLFVSAALLLLLGLVGLGMSRLTHAPNVFGYVSSMTVHNPYMALPPGVGPLDGMERARLLQNVQVQLADVRSSHDVGEIALISVDGYESLRRQGSDAFCALERKRLYR